MEDSREGIIVNERTIAAAQQIQPYGTVLDQASTISSNASLVTREDSTLASRFLLTLMSQANLVHLTRSEQMGNRKSLRIGLPGFGCKYCCQVGRLGLCRIFPARRRTLSAKARDLYEHLKRCSLCPSNVKELLQQLQLETQKGSETDAEKEKEFFDRVWARLGH